MLFLKYLHDLENERRDRAELNGETYAPMISGQFQWDKWAAPKKNGQLDHNAALTGEDLITFVDKELFPFAGNAVFDLKRKKCRKWPERQRRRIERFNHG